MLVVVVLAAVVVLVVVIAVLAAVVKVVLVVVIAVLAARTRRGQWRVGGILRALAISALPSVGSSVGPSVMIISMTSEVVFVVTSVVVPTVPVAMITMMGLAMAKVVVVVVVVVMVVVVRDLLVLETDVLVGEEHCADVLRGRGHDHVLVAPQLGRGPAQRTPVHRYRG